MTAAAGPPRPPREAATVVLLRPRGGDEEGPYDVYLVRRPQRAGFMPDSHVFPGGKVDATDADPALGGDPALAAAVREAFEECGILLCEDAHGAVPPESAARLGAERGAVTTGTLAFAALLAREGLRIARRRVHPWAHWITPSGEPVRFSARFFVARLPPGQIASHAPGELCDELWATPAEVLEREAQGALRLPPPTYFTLFELARLPTLRAVAEAARARVIATVLPKFAEADGVTRILLPWDPAYDATPGEGRALPDDFPRPPWSRHELRAGRWWRAGTG